MDNWAEDFDTSKNCLSGNCVSPNINISSFPHLIILPPLMTLSHALVCSMCCSFILNSCLTSKVFFSALLGQRSQATGIFV